MPLTLLRGWHKNCKRQTSDNLFYGCLLKINHLKMWKQNETKIGEWICFPGFAILVAYVPLRNMWFVWVLERIRNSTCDLHWNKKPTFPLSATRTNNFFFAASTATITKTRSKNPWLWLIISSMRALWLTKCARITKQQRYKKRPTRWQKTTTTLKYVSTLRAHLK